MGTAPVAGLAVGWRWGVWVSAMRVCVLLFLAGAWHAWIARTVFPFGGGEAHWVLMHIRPLGLRDGLLVGVPYAAAGVSLAVVLRARALWVTVFVGVGAALVAGALGSSVVGGIAGLSDGTVGQWLEGFAFEALPLVTIGLLAVGGRAKPNATVLWLAAWWPGLLHLPTYQLATGLPPRFREGVLFMWVVGGLMVGAVAKLRR